MALDDLPLEIGGEFCKIIWNRESRKLGKNLREGPKKVRDAATIIAYRMSPEVESYMKVNASWIDRTGNARIGLAARPFIEGDSIGIVLYHQVPYGIYLEVRFAGRYAIIQPTIDVMGPRVMAQYQGLLRRL